MHILLIIIIIILAWPIASQVLLLLLAAAGWFLYVFAIMVWYLWPLFLLIAIIKYFAGHGNQPEISKQPVDIVTKKLPSGSPDYRNLKY